MYSLSTCWNSHRHTDGRAMLREIRDLGFEYAELSHGIRISLLPGIFDAVDAGEIKISSLHNFCPLPMGIDRAAPNVYRFSSEDRRERDSAFKHTLKTLETAVRVQAKLVVLHTGSVDMKDYTDKLIDLVGEGKKETPRYEKLCQEVLELREKKKARYLQNAYELIERIVDEAKPRGLKLGIENREALEEIPFESDFDAFFKEFRDPTVVYWHDTGHAQIKENLGFISHRLHLQAMSPRLYGFHLHDVEPPGRDHRPPGQGCIDWAALKPVVKPEHLKIFEFSPSLSPAEAKAGVEYLQSVWGQ
ncbi:MAG TPA: sugar phosphate isomerase/epimerase [Verrucomicrobiae bacterium]|jgi:sugar phosphate isomerase/epimerase|nr:sugar phosphate isomerase/epimerase [Verrucomicrobiae bacterium]